jgi:hypothetical protein
MAGRLSIQSAGEVREALSLEWTIDALKVEQLRQVHQDLSNFSYGLTFQPVFVPPVAEPAVPDSTNETSN